MTTIGPFSERDRRKKLEALGVRDVALQETAAAMQEIEHLKAKLAAMEN